MGSGSFFVSYHLKVDGVTVPTVKWAAMVTTVTDFLTLVPSVLVHLPSSLGSVSLTFGLSLFSNMFSTIVCLEIITFPSG